MCVREMLPCFLLLIVTFNSSKATTVPQDDSMSDITRIIKNLNFKSFIASQNENLFPSQISKINDIDQLQREKIVSLTSRSSVAQMEFFEKKAQGDFFEKNPKTAAQDIPSSPGKREDPDAKKDVIQLATSLGYPAQNFTVKTKDGFLLTLHRIPHGRNQHNDNGDDSGRWFRESHHSTKNTARPPIFLQHGLLSSAADWVINFPNQSLAFVLADHGYDVWMGNSRGNTYSSRHVSLKPEDEEFWDWSFDEMAKYDTPAFIDFILNKTGNTSLYYVGHSQGTMMAFALFASIPEYQQKICLFIGLAPIISMNYMESPLKYLALLNDQEAFAVFGRKQFLTSSIYVKEFADKLCDDSLTNWICSDIVFVLCGHDTSNLNKTRLTVYMNHTPAGTSAKNMVHFAQFIRSRTFAMFDYGSPSENTKHYGQTTPPIYNASLARVPSLLFTAENDWIADVKDVKILESFLPNIVGKYDVPEWNHLDFVWGMDAAGKCYKNILEWLQKY